MAIGFWFSSSSLLIAAVLLSCGMVSPAQTPGEQPVVQGNNAFALELYGRLKAGEGNLFFSPYSISTCLAMTYTGARGTTEAQMARVLHFPANQAQLHSTFAELQRQLNSAQQKGIELSLANGLWAQQGHPFLPAFLQDATRNYDANVKQADFRTAANAVTREVNQWVAEKTKGKIQDILPPGTLNAMTRLVLANAIYFKGTWAKPFEKTATSAQPFHLSTSRQTEVQLMHHLDSVRYVENEALQAVELPYSGKGLALVVLLPRQIEGCLALENSLTAANLGAWLGQMTERKVDLFLPRFKLESRFELTQELARMGLTDAFQSGADFSGMDGMRDLFISHLLHKAWVEVNEEGTEAAAATAGVMAATAVRRVQPPSVFRADHPFVFLIRDTRSGSLLFLGRLANPGK